MRGRVNVVDLMNMPFNYVHELYRYTFSIKEEKEKERLEEAKAQKEKEEKEAKRKEINKMKPLTFDKRLSPAAQAKEAKELKSQADDKKSEDSITTTERHTPPSMSGLDIEDLTDMFEEGI